MSYKIIFKTRWANFLNRNFATNEQIGVAFGVTSVTAQNWREGITGAGGHNVIRALEEYPEEASELINNEGAR